MSASRLIIVCRFSWRWPIDIERHGLGDEEEVLELLDALGNPGKFGYDYRTGTYSSPEMERFAEDRRALYERRKALGIHPQPWGSDWDLSDWDLSNSERRSEAPKRVTRGMNRDEKEAVEHVARRVGEAMWYGVEADAVPRDYKDLLAMLRSLHDCKPEVRPALVAHLNGGWPHHTFNSAA